jgi:hypothetical protein
VFSPERRNFIIKKAFPLLKPAQMICDSFVNFNFKRLDFFQERFYFGFDEPNVSLIVLLPNKVWLSCRS